MRAAERVRFVDYFRASGNWGDFCKPVGKDDFECHWRAESLNPAAF
jgi:hypothetical protein